MKTINGHKYSKTEFEGYTHRAKYQIDVYNQEFQTNIDIYTDNPCRVSTTNFIISKTTDKVEMIELIDWTTKEQDESTAQFIKETLKDW